MKILLLTLLLMSSNADAKDVVVLYFGDTPISVINVGMTDNFTKKEDMDVCIKIAQIVNKDTGWNTSCRRVTVGEVL